LQVNNHSQTFINLEVIRGIADSILKKYDKWSLVVCVFTTEDARARKYAKNERLL